MAPATAAACASSLIRYRGFRVGCPLRPAEGTDSRHSIIQSSLVVMA